MARLAYGGAFKVHRSHLDHDIGPHAWRLITIPQQLLDATCGLMVIASSLYRGGGVVYVLDFAHSKLAGPGLG